MEEITNDFFFQNEMAITKITLSGKFTLYTFSEIHTLKMIFLHNRIRWKSKLSMSTAINQHVNLSYYLSHSLKI